MKNARFVLYRHYAEDGDLLYIGVSGSYYNRWVAHEKNSHWAYRVATITLERFKSRKELKRAEIIAIAAENPKHNVMRPEPFAVRFLHLCGFTAPKMDGNALAAAARDCRIDAREEIRKVEHLNQNYIWTN